HRLRCVSKHEGTQVGCSRLGHSILPISGKPEIGVVLILRDARTHARSTLRYLRTRALLRMRTGRHEVAEIPHMQAMQRCPLARGRGMTRRARRDSVRPTAIVFGFPPCRLALVLL